MWRAEERGRGAADERDDRPAALDGLHRRLRQEGNLATPGMASIAKLHSIWFITAIVKQSIPGRPLLPQSETRPGRA